MSSKSRIATASIGPIKAGDIKFPSLLRAPVEIMADVQHPYTKLLMEKLPVLTEDGLTELKSHLLTHNGLVNSMTRKEDVDSWIAMVDEEMAHRKKQQKSALNSLLTFLSTPRPEGPR